MRAGTGQALRAGGTRRSPPGGGRTGTEEGSGGGQPLIGVGAVGSAGTGSEPWTRLRAWQSLVQLVAPADSSIASSPSTPPIRPPDATDQRLTVADWASL